MIRMPLTRTMGNTMAMSRRLIAHGTAGSLPFSSHVSGSQRRVVVCSGMQRTEKELTEVVNCIAMPALITQFEKQVSNEQKGEPNETINCVPARESWTSTPRPGLTSFSHFSTFYLQSSWTRLSTIERSADASQGESFSKGHGSSSEMDLEEAFNCSIRYSRYDFQLDQEQDQKKATKRTT